jgi:catecholate siderophore receptor
VTTFFGDPTRAARASALDAADAEVTHAGPRGLELRNRTRWAFYDKFYENVFPGR